MVDTFQSPAYWPKTTGFEGETAAKMVDSFSGLSYRPISRRARSSAARTTWFMS